MTQNFYDCLKTLFGCCWSLLTSFHLPGTNITPAAMILFGAVAYISLKFFTNIIGTGGVQDANVFNSYRRMQEKPTIHQRNFRKDGTTSGIMF